MVCMDYKKHTKAHAPWLFQKHDLLPERPRSRSGRQYLLQPACLC